MKSPRITRNIKSMMLIGIFLVVCAFVAAGVYTYHSFNRMIGAVETLSEPNTKLVLLNEVMTEISNAEGSARAYTLTQEKHYLNSYWNQFSTIEARIQKLRENTQGNAYQLSRIDSVSTLLNEKQSNLQSFLLLKDKEAKNAPLRKALKIIDQKAKDNPTAAKNKVEPVTRLPRRGFNQKNKKSISPSARRSPYLPKRSTLISGDQTEELLDDVKNIISNMENEESKIKQYIGKQELDIIEQDWLIMSQIRSLIKDVRREELLVTKANATQAQSIATRSITTIMAIGGVTFLGCMIFLALVFKDLARSNYYRRNLLQSMRQTKKLAQAKEEFLANMSHEIRTPLNAIAGFLEQLKKTPLRGNQPLFVNTIESSSNHLLSIVNDILDLSKIESGKLVIDERPFSVKKVMQTVVDVMRVKAQEKNITISREMDAELDTMLLGDAHRLRQILFNLVGNAVKFTETGGVIVRARVQEISDHYVSIEFSVKDTGTGIARDKLEHIFGAFNQEDGIAGQRLGGTGLGLAISKKLVELQNGWISVESVPSQGSTFSFSIRYQRSSSTVPFSTEESLPSGEVSNRTVLVVDDDHVNRLLLEVLSEKWDAQVDIADSGAAALEKISRHCYDIILTDISMPEMSGTELMLEIRKHLPHIPIIAFTANAQPETLKKFLTLGFDDYLLKPFKESDLKAKIMRYAVAHPSAPPDEAQPSSLSEDLPPSAYSLDELTAITRNDPQTLIDILELIVTRCPTEIERMTDNAAQHKWPQVARQAHKLRSSFGQIGARGLVEDLLTIEKAALQDQPDAKIINQAVRLFAAASRAVFSSIQKQIRVMGEVA